MLTTKTSTRGHDIGSTVWTVEGEAWQRAPIISSYTLGEETTDIILRINTKTANKA